MIIDPCSQDEEVQELISSVKVGRFGRESGLQLPSSSGRPRDFLVAAGGSSPLAVRRNLSKERGWERGGGRREGMGGRVVSLESL